MTADFPSLPTRPDARLVALHAERGDPHARLAGALADLEGAGWGLTLAGEAALARQLGALLGPGTVRVDERLGVSRAALAKFGLAAAGLDADWTGARAVWLAEPDERLLRRAERVGVPVIVDATLAPGGGWFGQGATYVVYRHGVTLTGFGDTDLALLFGQGEVPTPAAPAPSDTAVALALRDVATLPLRLARVARTVATLAERLGGGALPFGPTALLLPPDSAPDTPWPPGGVLAATRSVDGGVVFTPGLQDAETALALLWAGMPSAPAPQPQEEARTEDRRPEREDDSRFRRDRDRFRRDRGSRADGPSDGAGTEPPRFARLPAPDQPRPDEARPDVPQPDSPPTRVTFEAPIPDTPAPRADAPAEEVWTPEIVFSGSGHEDPAPLPIPVSAGPDEPELEVTPPLAEPEAEQPAPEEEPADEAASDEAPEAPEPTPEPDPVPATPDLAPDLPVTTEAGAAPDPAADLTDEQAAIYARLREWRNAEAKRQEVSRFIIASNATLAEIARRVPYTMDDLKAVRGMGPERLRKYGEKMLEVVRG